VAASSGFRISTMPRMSCFIEWIMKVGMCLWERTGVSGLANRNAFRANVLRTRKTADIKLESRLKNIAFSPVPENSNRKVKSGPGPEQASSDSP
ncbi:MAG TPA: hypothetical protein VFD66_07610, partial [Verrucomicrobiae bacterium]|nr:hypothetical protein [Verrucomicrobiae bacterium]